MADEPEAGRRLSPIIARRLTTPRRLYSIAMYHLDGQGRPGLCYHGTPPQWIRDHVGDRFHEKPANMLLRSSRKIGTYRGQGNA
ncbi:unnamed protein product [Clonostachys rhizophaga]|uniref:Uncharacterized protein n=1 Tax=Clonostachys rhizophaga TaxID=160324 RepID=A0A9N9YI41_9HYPO|nr:unnamed protein product [Clonostachys rhizophaga]